jgi:hypothetical protein
MTAKVREAVDKMLAKEQCQGGRMIGGITDFRTGKFQDAATGIRSFLGVPKSWHRAQDCAGCAKKQAHVLKRMERNKEADLTERLAGES